MTNLELLAKKGDVKKLPELVDENGLLAVFIGE